MAWAFVLVLQIPDDRWFAADKVKHFFLAAFIQSVSYSALRVADVEHSAAVAAAGGITAFAAVGKELYDRRTESGFSPRDLVWDAAGASGATLLLSRTVR